MTDAIDNLNDLRRRILKDDIPTDEEMQEGLKKLRESRYGAQTAATEKKKKAAAKKVPINLEDLFTKKEEKKDD